MRLRTGQSAQSGEERMSASRGMTRLKLNHGPFRRQAAGGRGAWLILLLLAGFSPAATLTITPSAITNDFHGRISLLITGLATGQTVTVERYLDRNGNGIVEAGEPLILSFDVTDGQAPLIGGVRNLNVPADDDGLTNGQIRADIFLPSVAFTDFGAAGQSIFRVSDPLGHFAPVTQTLTVAEKVLSQGVAVRVTAAETGRPLTNALVALQPVSGAAAHAAVTDTNGSCNLFALPGSYGVLVYQEGLLSDMSRQVSIGCGQFATNEFAFPAGTLAIEGRVTNSVNGTGVPGIFVSGASSSNLMAASFTDANGHYTLWVNSNLWRIRPDKGLLAEAGFIGLAGRKQVTVNQTSVSNADFGVSPPTALVYGATKDTNGSPVPAMQVRAQDQVGQFDARGRSSTSNATYTLGVAAGTWTVGPTPDNLDLRGYTGPTSNVTVSAGQALQVDLVLTRTNLPSLSILAAPSAGQVELSLSGLAGLTYTVEWSPELGPPSWTPLLVTNASCNDVTVLDNPAASRQRFYRALVVP